ncbi:hypothetical protein [Brevundimonas sp. TSRC1-1]|uniref:hypothetical protein n=1 Tax=Brevundimonas sp. TSRC1-1 TaxID=2804562 RepID=UPI003CF324CB
MTIDKLEVEIDDLVLDLDNPRTGTVSAQADALEAIVRLNGTHFKNMMLSIKDHGLDPGDSFYVVEEGDDDGYVVVDGNRRLAALKVLNNPSLLQGTDLPDGTKKRLAEIAQGFTDHGTISCVLFQSRADAHDWIERRHGKGLDGEGRIAWGTLESDRFQRDRTIIDVITFVEKNSTFSDADWQRIKKNVEKTPTTLKRFLVSKPGRQLLGFVDQSGESGPQFKRNPKFVLRVLSQLFSDIDAGDVNSRTQNTASEIADYIETLPDGLGSTPQPTTTPHSFSETLVKDGATRPRQSSEKSKVDKTKTKKVSPPRSTLAPSKQPFAEPDDEKGKQLIREASKLKLRETPLGCAFLFRAVLEYAIDTEMRASNISRENADGKQLDLSGRFDSVYKYLNATAGRVANKGDLTAIRQTLTARNGPVSFGALNGFVHNRYQKPSPDDLRTAWDHAVPLLVAIYGAH